MQQFHRFSFQLKGRTPMTWTVRMVFPTIIHLAFPGDGRMEIGELPGEEAPALAVENQTTAPIHVRITFNSTQYIWPDDEVTIPAARSVGSGEDTHPHLTMGMLPLNGPYESVTVDLRFEGIPEDNPQSRTVLEITPPKQG